MNAIFLIPIPKGHRLDELSIDYKLYADGEHIEIGQNYPIKIPTELDAEGYEYMFPGSNAEEEVKGWNRLIEAMQHD